MCGLTVRPFSTAFFASSPAASSTPGFDVFVHDVIAAISTSPLPMSGSFGAGGVTLSGVGRLSTISTTSRGCPFDGSVMLLSEILPAADLPFPVAKRRPSLSAGCPKPFDATGAL